MASKQQIANTPVKRLVESPTIQNKFNEVLGKRAPQFIQSLLNVVNGNQQLQKVDQGTVIASAMVAASLNLPVDQNLGYIYIVPYGGRAQPQRL
nr:recombinase RecT [Lactobacillus selangorensis]